MRQLKPKIDHFIRFNLAKLKFRYLVRYRYYILPFILVLVTIVITVLAIANPVVRTYLTNDSSSYATLSQDIIVISLLTLLTIGTTLYFWIDYRQHNFPLKQADPSVQYSFKHHLQVVTFPLLRFKWKPLSYALAMGMISAITLMTTLYVAIKNVQAATTISVTINQKIGQADPTPSVPVLFTATFSEPIDPTSFTAGDVVLTGTATGKTVDSITQVAPNNGTKFEIAVSASGYGTIIATIPSVSNTYTSAMLASTGNSPFGIITDSSGNVYTANTNSDNVTKITPSGTSTILATTGDNPQGIALDSAGNIYTSNVVSNNVSKITPAGVSTILGTTGSGPADIVVDSANNVYVVNIYSDSVTKITPAGVSSTLGTTGSSPSGIAIDGAGNIYTSNSGSDNVSKITPAGVSTILGTAGDYPTDIVLDSLGNVYTSNFLSGNVTKITPAGVSTVFGPGSGIGSYGIAKDSDDNIYVASGFVNVTKISPAGVATTIPSSIFGASNQLALDSSGNIYVSTGSMDTVMKFTKVSTGVFNIGGDINFSSTSTDNTVSYADTTSFITTWSTTTSNEQITIPTYPGESYNYTVDWGDGNTSTGQTGNAAHTYALAGIHTVKISGTFPRIYFNNTGDKQKILTIEQWGTNPWTSMQAAFSGASNLTITATDTPNLSGVTNMRNMFTYASSINTGLSSWDVSNVTDMTNTFAYATSFNSSINNWDVSNVTDMTGMFIGATSFNQPLDNWNIGNVDLSNIFADASSFNQPLNSWDVSNVTNMPGVFALASSFNQPLNNWNVSNVTNMNGLFFGASSFNQPLNSWDVSNVTDMNLIFSGAMSFDQSLGSWNVSNVLSMNSFFGAYMNVTVDAGLSTPNYDATLIGWSAQTLQNNVTFDAGTSQYCNAATERANIISSFNWTINDAGLNCTVTQVDLSLSKTLITSSPIQSGNTVTYHMTVGNNGPDTGYMGQIIDMIPSEFSFVSNTNPLIDCNDLGPVSGIGDPYLENNYSGYNYLFCYSVAPMTPISAGSTLEFDIVGTASSDFVNASTKNRAILMTGAQEASFTQAVQDAANNNVDMFTLPYNNIAESTYSSTPPPVQTDFSLTKTLTTPGPIQSGNNVTYHFKVTNEGPNNSYYGGYTYDILPTEFSFVSNTNPNVTCVDFGLAENMGSPYFATFFSGHHVLGCLPTNSDSDVLNSGGSIEFDITGTATANFTSNSTKNRSVYFDFNNETAFSNTIDNAVANNIDFTTLPGNNVSNVTYSYSPNNPNPDPSPNPNPNPTPPPTTTPTTPRTPRTPRTPTTPSTPSTPTTPTFGTSPGSPVISTAEPLEKINTREVLGRHAVGILPLPLYNFVHNFSDSAAQSISWLLLLILLLLALVYGWKAYRQYQANKLLLAALTKLRNTKQATDTYLSIINHYLNTPIAIMSGAIELLASLKKIPEQGIARLQGAIAKYKVDVAKLLDNGQLASSDTAQTSGGHVLSAGTVITADATSSQNSTANTKSSVPAASSNYVLSLLNTAPKSGGAFKKRAVYIPVIVVSVSLLIVGFMFTNSQVYRLNPVQLGLQLLCLALVSALLAINYHQRDVQVASEAVNRQAIISEQQLIAQRTTFIDQASKVLADHYESLAIICHNYQAVPETKTLFNGLAMLGDTAHSLGNVSQLSHLSTDAPIRNLSQDIPTYLTGLQKAIELKKLSFTINIPPSLGLAIQPEELRQLVQSTVNNAIQFSPENSIINITAKQSGKNVLLTVTDHGPGIAPDKLNQLFQPFSRASGTETYDHPGLGLSLHVDKLITEKLGGNIQVSNVKGNNGTTVTISLPAVQASSKMAPVIIAPR